MGYHDAPHLNLEQPMRVAEAGFNTGLLEQGVLELDHLAPALPEQRPTYPTQVSIVQPISFRREVRTIPSTTYGAFSLYRYPAKFIPQAVAFVIERYATRYDRILDPFAGSGTTGLTARIYGLEYELWDLNPLLEWLHRVAILPPPRVVPAELIEALRRSNHSWLPNWSRLSYWYPEPILPVLAQAWGYFHALEQGTLKDLLAIPLLKATKHFSYNDAQRQKLSRSPKATARVNTLMEGDHVATFWAILHEELVSVLRKLYEYQQLLGGRSPSYRVQAGVDSLAAAQNLSSGDRWQMLITSPPYLQAQEYIRCSKLDLLWLGYSEDYIRSLAKTELPYRKVEAYPIRSETYQQFRAQIEEPHLLQLFDQYFYAVLGTLGRLAERVEAYLCIFVGQATVRGRRVPIDTIFAEHFVNAGWHHEATFVDTIQARVMFRSKVNPATGIEDQRMPTEHMVILRR